MSSFSCYPQGSSPGTQYLMHVLSLTGILNVPGQPLPVFRRSCQGLGLRDGVACYHGDASFPKVKFPRQTRLSLLGVPFTSHLPLRQIVRDRSRDTDFKAGEGHLCPGLNICLHCDLITPILSPLVGGVPAAHGLH